MSSFSDNYDIVNRTQFFANTLNMVVPIIKKEEDSFSPLNIEGCVGWWDASDASTITLNGSKVSSWNDKSGNNYTLSQTTESTQPDKGEDYVGVQLSDYMQTGTLNLLDRKYLYMFSVAKPTVEAYRNIIGLVSAGGTNAMCQIEFEATTKTFFGGGRRSINDSFTRNTSTGTYAINNTYLCITQNLYNDAICKTSINDTEWISNPFLESGIMSDVAYNIYLGDPGPGSRGGIDIKELICYSTATALTTEQVTLIKTYLNTKWTIY